MIRWESGFKARAVNRNEPNNWASIGLGQLQLPTASMHCGATLESHLLKVKTNLECAARYLRYQLDRYDGSYYKAISAYNAGTFWKRHTNSKYVKRILRYATELREKRRLSIEAERGRQDPYWRHRRHLRKQESFYHKIGFEWATISTHP